MVSAIAKTKGEGSPGITKDVRGKSKNGWGQWAQQRLSFACPPGHPYIPGDFVLSSVCKAIYPFLWGRKGDRLGQMEAEPYQEESLTPLGLKCASDVMLDTIPRGFFSLLFILFCFSSLVHTSLWEKQRAKQSKHP